MCASPFDKDQPLLCDSCDGLIFIGKTRPLSTFSRWKRIVIRLAYWLTDYSAEQESAGIARTWEEAAALVAAQPVEDGRRDGYFGQKLPVGALLPDEPCQLEPTRFFETDAPEFYENYRPEFIAVPTPRFKELDDRLESLSRSSKAARHA